MARVSSPSPKSFMEGGVRLLNYLIDHAHWSPFEMASMCVKIRTTRSISTQILRHRSFSFQEFSQRYSSPDSMEFPEFRPQASKNRQSSVEDPNFTLPTSTYRLVQQLIDDSHSVYSELIEQGVARECARDILPLGTPTMLYMHGTIRSWIHSLQLRLKPDTQLEHRQIATSIAGIFNRHFPIISEVIF